MNNTYVFSLLVCAFVILMVTFVAITRLHRRQSTHLSFGVEQDEVGEPLWLYKWPLLNLLELNWLPHRFESIGLWYGFVLTLIASSFLLIESIFVPIVAKLVGFAGNSYMLEGIWQALQAKSFVRLLLAIPGWVLGVSVVVLHVVSFFGWRLIPVLNFGI